VDILSKKSKRVIRIYPKIGAINIEYPPRTDESTIIGAKIKGSAKDTAGDNSSSSFSISELIVTFFVNYFYIDLTSELLNLKFKLS
tara:strand:+ start:532 stop:789 length:258 start_codon:yes stop_codon:yes gene_type:complete